MKKVLMVIGGLLIVGALAIGSLWWCSRVSNPWDAKCVGDIPAPMGYERVGAEKGTLSISQMSKAKLALALPWRERVRVSEHFR